MKSPDHDRVGDLFLEARELPARERTRFLKDACEGDNRLREEVESLLSADQGAELLERVRGIDLHANLRHVCHTLDGGSKNDLAHHELPQQIGAYRIVRVIGQGGMGIVYEAEQEHPKRRVALKVIRPGMASRRIVKRFQHEAEVLGQLQHPGIAHIYESGFVTAEEGRMPFFAMEYIDGSPLHVHVRTGQLNLREKLELVARACDAVQHAHQKGIVHRDLKPDNILVVNMKKSGSAFGARRDSRPITVIDTIGQPKILDFGVARVTDADIRTVTVQTDVGQLVGTLAYMSPEQVKGDSRDLDTRCDIYALGVILYELLSGRIPHDLSHEPISEAARIIREVDPVRLSSIDASLRGDVDTIIGKAMAKDRDRRYASAAELAADIRHYLHDEPIGARPASTFYQLRKFVRRNRALVGGVGATLVATVLGLIFAVQGFVTASRERDEKQQAFVVADAVTEFLAETLAAAEPGRRGRDVTLLEVMDDAAVRIEEQFTDAPLVRARLSDTIGWTYRALGKYDLAEPLLMTAMDLRRETLGADDRATLETQERLGWVRYYQGRFEEATQTFESTLERVREALGESDLLALEAAGSLAFMRMQEGSFDEAELLFKKTIARMEAMPDRDETVFLDLRSNLALVYTRMGRTEDATPLYEQVIEENRRLRGAEHPETILQMANFASLMIQNDRYDDALSLLSKVLEIQTRVLGPQHAQTLITVLNTGVIHFRRESAETESILLGGLGTAIAEYGENHPRSTMFKSMLGQYYYRTGDSAKAASLLVDACDADLETESGYGYSSESTCSHAVNALLDLGKIDEAKSYCKGLLVYFGSDLDAIHPPFGNTLVACLIALRDSEEAERKARKCIALWTENGRAKERATLVAGSLLGESLVQQGRFDEAEDLLLESHEKLVQQRDQFSFAEKTLSDSRERIARFYDAWGKAKEARRWRSVSGKPWDASPSNEHP